VVLFRFPLGCLSESICCDEYPDSNWNEDSSERVDESGLLPWELRNVASWLPCGLPEVS
jgi:hypothetical protein